MAIEMTNVLLSLVLGLWLLIVVAFYAWIVGAVLCRIAAGLKRAVLAIPRPRGRRVSARYRIP